MDTAYQLIWDADQSENGVPAVRPGEATDEAVGFVVVDERATSVGADHKVLAKASIPPSKKATYDLCAKLLDNYALERQAAEFVRPEETQEELDFINAILPTKPMQTAREILARRLGRMISNETLAAMVKETWFKMGSAGNQSQASGFEHVFVGEQGSQRTKIGGYHYWHKYLLDDGVGGDDRIRYRGTRYQGAIDKEKGILVPEVVTLSLVWEAPSGDQPNGPPSRTLEKPIGGFFVGCSPECMIAFGLIRCRTMGGKITRINGAEYQLDLHRLDNEPNSIRTFFPRFRRADVVDIVPPDPGPVSDQDDETSPSEPTGTFRMLAAMVNPRNPEGGREFIQILNVSATTASLQGWQVVAPNGTRYELSDVVISPGDVFKFTLPGPNGALRNRAGTLRLLDDAGNANQIVTYTTEEARREGAPIVF